MQDKGRGSLSRPRPMDTAPQSGSGFSVGGRNFNFLLGQVVGNQKVREEIAWFQHSARWLSQVVFRDFAGISAGVIFHPLGSSWGSAFPLLLQPPYSRRVQAGIYSNIAPQNKE